MLETAVGMQVDVGELRDHEVQAVVLLQPGDFWLEVELVEDVADLGGKGFDVGRQVGGDLVRLAFELGEVELARVVE